jgi:hypothetical protein
VDLGSAENQRLAQNLWSACSVDLGSAENQRLAQNL